MTSVTIAGRPVRLKTAAVIGKGGEADIYRLDPQTVLKLYKLPSDLDYAADKAAQAGARQRIKEQQTKLPAFPGNLPAEVVVPKDLALGKDGRVAGYTMPYVTGMEPLISLGNRAFRETGGIDANQVVGIFRELHRVVDDIHGVGVVIGDFNDLNVLTDLTSVRVVDADSMQFGTFPCRTFTSRFVDPLNCEPTALRLSQRHDRFSDWYAYFVMLIQSLLYVGPYGGVHRPGSGRRLQHDARVLSRLTVLHPDVTYPKPALPLDILPDDWQHYLAAVCERDVREPFPEYLLGIRFTACTGCGMYHARSVCPQCTAPGAIKQTVTVRGEVMATRVFTTPGSIVHATVQYGTLRYLYQQDGALYREGGRRLMTAELSAGLRFRIQGDTTLIGRHDVLLSVAADGTTTRSRVEQYRSRLPMFDTNGSSTFWLQDSQLVGTGRLGPQYLGDILLDQTMFWVGSQLGFGFFQAGRLTRAFTFVPSRRGLNDQVELGAIPGQLVDATCALSDSYAWFFVTSNVGGQLSHHVTVVQADGTVVARAEAQAGEDSWLGHGIRGHLAVGSGLFVALDDGMVRVGVDGGTVTVEREFPDTEPFVDSNVTLLPGIGGIYAVSHRSITLLTIK